MMTLPLILLASTTAKVWPLDTTLIVDGTFPVSEAGILTPDILRLDDLDRLKARYESQLPKNSSEAGKVFQAILRTKSSQAVQQEFALAHRAVIVALRHDIDRYPALIIGGKYIIFGVTDMSVAYRIYNDWQTKKIRGNHETR